MRRIRFSGEPTQNEIDPPLNELEERNRWRWIGTETGRVLGAVEEGIQSGRFAADMTEYERSVAGIIIEQELACREDDDGLH